MNTILYVGEHSCTHKVQWHSHEEWELMYCTSGEGAFQLQDGVRVHALQVRLPDGDSRIFYLNASKAEFLPAREAALTEFFPKRSRLCQDGRQAEL